MILDFHGIGDALPAARRAVGASEGGVTAESLLQAARRLGIGAEGFRATVDMLRDLPLPAMLHWKRGHFVVLEEVTRAGVVIVDPAMGRRTMTRDEAAREFGEIALAFDAPARPPAPVGGSRRSLLTGVTGAAGGALAWLVVVFGLECAFLVALARLLAWSVGEWVKTGRVTADTGAACLVGVLMIAGLRVLGEHLDDRVRRRIGGYFTAVFAKALVAAPPIYTLTRTTRFLEYTAAEVDPDVNRQIPQPTALLSLAPAILCPILVFSRSFAAGRIVIATSLLYLALVSVGALARRSASRTRINRVQKAREWLRAVVQQPEDLLAAGAREHAIDAWLRLRRLAHDARWHVLPPLLPSARAAFAMSLLLCWWGLWALGSSGGQDSREVLFLQLVGALALTSLARATKAVKSLIDWLPALARLGALRSETEPIADASAPPLMVVGAASSPIAVEMRSVSCDAQSGALPVLRDVNLSIRPGDAIAILGGTGAGKTLLARLLLGMAMPDRGAVVASAGPVVSLPVNVRQRVVRGVFADAELLDVTIGENLRVGDPSVSDRTLIDVCRLVGIDDWIASLPLGFATPVTRQGAVFPHHRRQLLCLARVLVRPSTVLVVDSLLDALDAPHARTVVERLASRAAAVILLTSRSDIIPPAFRLLRLADGELLARVAGDAAVGSDVRPRHL